MRYTPYPISPRPRNAGFSMIEVLISIVVMSIGLLGLAGLQATGLRNNSGANLRSLATMQVYDMSDRMRANAAGVTAGLYDDISGVGSSTTCAIKVGGCSTVQMAQFDKYMLNSNNAALLPNGTGTVKRGATGLFTITVSWKDPANKDGSTSSFAMSVQQ